MGEDAQTAEAGGLLLVLDSELKRAKGGSVKEQMDPATCGPWLFSLTLICCKVCLGEVWVGLDGDCSKRFATHHVYNKHPKRRTFLKRASCAGVAKPG